MAIASSSVAVRVLLALGSNLGDRIGYLRAATAAIVERGYLERVRFSPIYETAPVGCSDQPNFLNCCITGTTSLPPDQLHSTLKALEVELGRKPRPRWHEREIDVDLILYGNLILRTPELEIPHPQALERAFVLIPAQAIAPEWIFPGTGRTIGELAATVKAEPPLRQIEESLFH
ncbi:MAG: 2-amino-4-hydroxy-6-hydroxymethyldihydropteridine diphosphokinase [Chlorobiota bacterium]|nr:MAG: 2-amino-4-hydroxy-6-hydroxymethyldihydropteridine diphosphokinase [Chlorobiota bacterium]